MALYVFKNLSPWPKGTLEEDKQAWRDKRDREIAEYAAEYRQRHPQAPPDPVVADLPDPSWPLPFEEER